MWSPTHVQVVVQRAKNLRTKGKHGTNDTYVTIQLGKEKYQTSVQEKTVTPEWHEECELLIPDGNTSTITLAVFHRNFVGLDKFLGRVDIPLQELDIYERPRNKFYPLRAKPNKNDGKARGELEICFAFVVKSVTGSLIDLSKKPQKGGSLPLRMVHNVGGSLMNLAGKDKKLSLQNLKHSLGGKLSDKLPRKKSPLKDPAFIEEKDVDMDDDNQFVEDYSDLDAVSTASSGHLGDAVVTSSTYSDGLQESNMLITQETLSAHDKLTSSEVSVPPTPINVLSGQQPQSHSEHASEIMENHKNISSTKDKSGTKTNSTVPASKDNQGRDSKTRSARMQMNSALITEKQSAGQGQQTFQQNVINERSPLIKLAPKEVLLLYEAMTKQELVELLCKQRKIIENQQCQISDLEDYIDNLLVRVMDSTPRILQKPYKCKSYC